ncbi:MAG: gamma carbonic anhydrase family protein [Proteobacteria bacterium]|nr:gamma carbonic anhydrase family protein [Pseudomonadota bacterium]
MIILPYKGIVPKIDETAFVAVNAAVMGDVVIGPDTGIWYGCTVRGDVNIIRIGARTNIQDGTVIHVATRGHGTHIGDDVTVGHMALLHDCTIEDGAYVGMQACVMDGAVVEKRAFVAAGALVTPGKRVPTGQLWAGRPAKYVRDLNDEDYALMDWSGPHYVRLAQEHKKIA